MQRQNQRKKSSPSAVATFCDVSSFFYYNTNLYHHQQLRPVDFLLLPTRFLMKFSSLLVAVLTITLGHNGPLSLVAMTSAAGLITTTQASTASTSVLYPKDGREFILRTYRDDELSPDDAFCYKLAQTCPYLTSRTARPTSSTNIRVRVRVDFRPTHFAGIDDLQQQFSVVGTFIFNWQLPRCARWHWTHEQYQAAVNKTLAVTMALGNLTDWANNVTQQNLTTAVPSLPMLPYNRNVTECRFKKNEIWHPAIRHVNAISKPDIFETNGRDVVLTADGRAHWEASVRLDSTCRLTFRTFPFDRQRCSIVLGRYNYHDFIFHDEMIDEQQSELQFINLLRNSIWELDDFTTSIDASNITIRFDVSRISESYAGTIFVPTTLLSMLQMSTVLMPPETTDRSAFSITGFVALAVFQSLFTSSIPVTSELLYITLYYEVQMAIGVLITVYSLLICRLLGRYKRLGEPCLKLKSGFKLRLVDAIDLSLFLISLILFIGANFVFYFCGNTTC